MNSSTLKTIIALNLTLFITIEAAQAGILHRVKVFLLQQFDPALLIILSLVIILVSGVLYVLFTPVLIGNQKTVWLNVSGAYKTRRLRARKAQVKRISAILHKEAA